MHRFVRLSPARPAALVAFGTALTDGDHVRSEPRAREEGLGALCRAAALDPASADVIGALAGAAFRLGRFAEVLRLIRWLQRIDPRSAGAHAMRSVVASMLGNLNANAVDARRSVPLAALAPLAAVPGIAWISLQKGGPAAQAKAPPPGMKLADWTDEVGDFADTAALIAQLGLVISVDTAVCHLAGALAKPVWVLSRFDANPRKAGIDNGGDAMAAMGCLPARWVFARPERVLPFAATPDPAAFRQAVRKRAEVQIRDWSRWRAVRNSGCSRPGERLRSASGMRPARSRGSGASVTRSTVTSSSVPGRMRVTRPASAPVPVSNASPSMSSTASGACGLGGGVNGLPTFT